MMEGNLFPILSFDRAYYVYGSKEYKVIKRNVPIFLLFPAAFVFGSFTVDEKVVRKLRLFSLDMGSGEIF